MSVLDMYDIKIMETIMKYKTSNLGLLKLKCNSREGQKTFKERLIRLETIGLIEIDTSRINRRGYEITPGRNAKDLNSYINI